MDTASLISRYRQTIVGVETQSCDHGERLVGDAWRERGCGVSYEYSNDIEVRSDIEQAVQDARFSDDQLAVLADLDARLKKLLAANSVATDGTAFWRNGLPAGVAE